MRQVYRFEGFTLDLVSGCLTGPAGEASLRHKSFEVLRFLVENPGRLVSKDELVDAVWARVAVADDAVAQCISEIRLALGDTQQRIIRTFPRRGYRFDVPVEAASSASEPAPSPAATIAPVVAASQRARALRWPWALALAGGVLLLVFVWAGMRSHSPPAAADRATIAVLRFANLSPDSGQDYLAEGLSEDLITGLSKFSSLFVIARHSAFTAGNEPADAKEIGRDLGARYLLMGSVRRDGDRLRITARLIDAEAGLERWAETYDQSYVGLFKLQDDLTRKIVGTLVPRLNQSELVRSLRKTPQSLSAYDYYLRGNSLLKNRSGAHRGDMVQQARELLEAAMAADPNYAPAIQGLAEALLVIWLEHTDNPALAGEFRRPETLERARTLAEQALRIDPFLAEAHATLGWILHWQYHREAAPAEFEKALVLNPNLADGRYAHILMQDGHPEQAIEVMQQVMRHDPFPPDIYLSWLGNSYYLLGRCDEAFATLSAGAERMPDYPSVAVWLSAAAARSGHLADAARATARVRRLVPDFTIAGWLDFIRLPPEHAANLRIGLELAELPDQPTPQD